MPDSTIWNIPDSGEGVHNHQSILMETYLDALALGIKGEGIVSGCVVTAQGSPDMTVAVSTGVVRIEGTIVGVTGANVTITAADATNPRIDIIQVNSVGTLSAVAGTPAASPKAPALSGTAIALAYVYVPANDTTIATNQIQSLRIIAFAQEEVITFVIDGAGAVISTGVKGDLEVPCDSYIYAWTVLADQSGSIVVDVWKDTYANFPPTVADTIAGTEKPTISSATKGQDTSLTTWTPQLSQGDILRFNVDSCTSITRATVILRVIRRE